jgi:hypothetical protein
VWLTDVSQIPDASIESLERSLITCDGRGKELKRAALDELKRRISSPNDQGDSQMSAAKELNQKNCSTSIKTLVSESTFRSQGKGVNEDDDMVRITIDMKRTAWWAWKRKMFPSNAEITRGA